MAPKENSFEMKNSIGKGKCEIQAFRLSVVVVVFQRITIIQRNSLLLSDFIFVCFFTATIPIFLKFKLFLNDQHCTLIFRR